MRGIYLFFWAATLQTTIFAADPAAPRDFLLQWKLVLQDNNTSAVDDLLKNGWGIPSDALAVVSCKEMATYLLGKIPKICSPESCQILYTQATEVMDKNNQKNTTNPLACFAFRGWGDLACELIKRGVSPYVSTLTYTNKACQSVSVNVFEWLLAHHKYKEAHSLETHMQQNGIPLQRQSIRALPYIMLFGRRIDGGVVGRYDKNAYAALAYALEHDVCGMRNYVDGGKARIDSFRGYTPLHSVVLDCENMALVTKFIYLFCKYGARLNEQTTRAGYTILHCAALRELPGSQPLMDFLKRLGVDSSMKAKADDGRLLTAGEFWRERLGEGLFSASQSTTEGQLRFNQREGDGAQRGAVDTDV